MLCAAHEKSALIQMLPDILPHRVVVVDVHDTISVQVGPADHAGVTGSLDLVAYQDHVLAVDHAVAVDVAWEHRELRSEGFTAIVGSAAKAAPSRAIINRSTPSAEGRVQVASFVFGS